MKDDLVNTSVVAVIDGCRKRTKECDRDELTFLCDNRWIVLVKYF